MVLLMVYHFKVWAENQFIDGVTIAERPYDRDHEINNRMTTFHA